MKAILEVEAPLSEELLLKRIVWCFGREKVTKVVLHAYEQQMSGYQQYGIIRKNGFLYLANGKKIQFRKSGDIEREIKQIAPEELAAGMLEILKQNVSADKNGLYHSLAIQSENMISYRPLFKTMAQKNISSYALFKMGFSKATYHSIKKGNSISTNTVNQWYTTLLRK